MVRFTNSYVLGEVLKALYHVSARKTTFGFAAKVIGSIVKTLEKKYPFLKFVTVNDKGEILEDEAIFISPEIDAYDREDIGRAIEAITRVVYMDIIGKAGLFFIAELQRRAGEDLMNELYKYKVDLAALQVEQHYLYRSREKKKRLSRKPDDVSLLGYTWKNVASWKYDQAKQLCVLYDREGNILDNLNFESIIENYVKNLSDDLKEVPEEISMEVDKVFQITTKELELLKMLERKDMDAETAIRLLHIDKNEFDNMVKRLLENDLLQYISFNVIELTEVGMDYITRKSSFDKEARVQ
jgi:hypothetical protein